jgi:hypothetical protein
MPSVQSLSIEPVVDYRITWHFPQPVVYMKQQTSPEAGLPQKKNIFLWKRIKSRDEVSM